MCRMRNGAGGPIMQSEIGYYYCWDASRLLLPLDAVNSWICHSSTALHLGSMAFCSHVCSWQFHRHLLWGLHITFDRVWYCTHTLVWWGHCTREQDLDLSELTRLVGSLSWQTSAVTVKTFVLNRIGIGAQVRTNPNNQKTHLCTLIFEPNSFKPICRWTWVVIFLCKKTQIYVIQTRAFSTFNK